jgi:hypothetical protein
MEKTEKSQPSAAEDLPLRLALVEATISKTVSAFDANVEVYGDAFKSIDASLYVLMRVQQDIFLFRSGLKLGEELLLLKDKDGQTVGIDYYAYLREYWCCAMMAEAVEPLHQKHYPKTTEDAASEESSEPDLVFGGGT